MCAVRLRPFWNYYGGKYKAALSYPEPRHDIIIEPFAGAAGYSIRHPNKQVILCEKNPKVAAVWKYLLTASADEILNIPIVRDVDHLPEDIALGARYLVGFNMNTGVASPAKTLSAIHRNNRDEQEVNSLFHNGTDTKTDYESGWGNAHREMVARQAMYIQSKQWKIIEGDYTNAPDVVATWFIDPPYANIAGQQYPYHDIDYPALGEWCKQRRGQVMVCENKGATWLPFKERLSFQPSINKKDKMTVERSVEVLWQNDDTPEGFFM